MPLSLSHLLALSIEALWLLNGWHGASLRLRPRSPGPVSHARANILHPGPDAPAHIRHGDYPLSLCNICIGCVSDKLVFGNSPRFLTPGIWFSKDYPNKTAGPNSGIDSKPCGTHITANGTHAPDANRSLATCARVPGGEGCPRGCLFQVFDDEGEHVDLSETMASRKAEMTARLRLVGPTVFQSDANASFPDNFGVHDSSDAWKAESGFVVPWL
eukprot:COSAG01_NODE_4683_length_4818_cov_2.240305_5_plen_215_part_00